MESVLKVRTRSDFQMELELNTGETHIFDVRPYLEKGVFQRLKDMETPIKSSHRRCQFHIRSADSGLPTFGESLCPVG
jgi:hypothetical protein